MNIKTANDRLLEAKRMFEQARELLSGETVTDDQRAQATSLREQAQRIKSDAALIGEIEREAKGFLAAADASPAPAAPNGYAAFGEFLEAVAEAKSGGMRDPRLTWLEREGEEKRSDMRKALSGTTGATGGFLIPDQFRAELLAVMTDSSNLLGRVMRMPMSSRTVQFSVLDYSQPLAAGIARQFGGVQAFWDDEGASIGESEPKFRDFTLTAHELTVYTEANNSLLADSAVSLSAFLASDMGMAGAVNWKIAHAILRGNGVGQPLGVLNAPVLLTQAREAANTVGYVDLTRLEELAMPSSRLEWRASISLKAMLRTLQDPEGHYIWADARSGMPATLMGYPITFDEHLPRRGTTGDILFGDFSYYIFGDRQNATLDASTEANFRRNRTAWRLIYRGDGAPWMNAPLTLQDGTTQVSPFATLTSTVSS